MTKLMPKSALENFQHYSAIYDWQSYKKFFSLVNNVSPESINILQKDMLKTFIVNSNKPALKAINNIIMDSQIDLQSINTPSVESQVSQNIKAMFTGLKKQLDNPDFEKKWIVLKAQYNKLVRDYANQTYAVQSLVKSNNINYNKLDLIGKSYYKLEQVLDALENSKELKDCGYQALSNLRLNPNTGNLISNKIKGSVSIIRRLSGIGSALAGIELEDKATQQVTNYLSKTLNYLGVKKTGGISVKTGANAVFIKEDIAIFDTSKQSEKVQLGDGTFITLKNLLKKIDGNEKVTVSTEGYEQLQNLMMTGISAKNVSGDKITLHSGLTTKAILNAVAIKDEAYWSLQHMHTLAQNFSQFQGNANYNKLIINYNMSHMLPQLIGKKNYFIVTPNGIELMYDFLNGLLQNRNYYIKVSPASYTKSMQVQT